MNLTWIRSDDNPTLLKIHSWPTVTSAPLISIDSALSSFFVCFLHRCFTCLSAPPQTMCMCSHPHAHFYLPSAMRYKITHKRLSCAPSSLISACHVSTWLEWSVADSKDIFSETGPVSGMLCGGLVIKLYHSSPLGHTFIIHDGPGGEEI